MSERAGELTNMLLRRALKHHPDKGGDPDKFKEITHAYVATKFARFVLTQTTYELQL